MTDHPKWDYWRFEKLGDGRIIDVETPGWLIEGDIREEKYSTDQEKWCRRYLWTAEQAALISFSRDPEKVLNDRNLLPLHDDPNDPHSALIGHIDHLMGLIHEAQATKVLPKLFEPMMYVEWAAQMGVDFPPYLKKELDAVEHERDRGLKTNSEVGLHNGTPSDLEDEPDKKPGSQRTRFENNLRKIILALLEAARLDKADSKSISDKLQQRLDVLADARKDNRFQLDASTIKERIDEARDLYLK